MKELMLLLSAMQGRESENIKLAKGSREFTGKIFESVKKILENGNGKDIN